MKKAVSGLVAIYIAIGVAIVAMQAFTGTRCDPPGVIPAVTANYPPGLLWALLWPASFYENVWKNGVSLQEYISPNVCIERP